MEIDHLGMAVKSIESARAFYEELGLKVSFEETVAHEKVKVAMIPVGTSRIELLEATEEASTVAKFINKRGEGLHHIALLVDSLPPLIARLKEKGVRLISDRVQIGAGGHRYIFVHPSSAGGVLLELCENSPAKALHREKMNRESFEE